MPGAFTEHLDAVQLIVAAFFAFFAGLVIYLRREDKREGYPLWDISPRGVPIEGFPAAPPTKYYTMLDGSTTSMPNRTEPSAMRGAPMHKHIGAPMAPIGDPMTAEIGPGAYPMRLDKPFINEGAPQVQPMRVASGWRVAKGDPDPRGMTVYDAARQAVGTVTDLWVDRSVKFLRYLEVRLEGDERPVLVPIFHTDVRARRRAVLLTVMSWSRLHSAPRLKSPDEITAREEDQVNAYFASAYMYGRDFVGETPASSLLPRFPG